ncbi:MAG TPA: Os1348 family NHLP clan protein [Anaerolineales bacterium]|nr:Os1348 family NHLP clan protein [Anaerolineales bacterium]
MADYTVRWILGRAISNPAYRELMATNPEAAWQGYDLTAEDLAELKSWTPGKILDYLADLERKVSTAAFDGVAGYNPVDSAASTNCDDPLSMAELKKLFGGDAD